MLTCTSEYVFMFICKSGYKFVTLYSDDETFVTQA